MQSSIDKATVTVTINYPDMWTMVSSQRQVQKFPYHSTLCELAFQ